MPEKPTTAAGYAPNQVARVKSTCLYLATKLGDLMDERVVVGGLVPSKFQRGSQNTRNNCHQRPLRPGSGFQTVSSGSGWLRTGVPVPPKNWFALRSRLFINLEHASQGLLRGCHRHRRLSRGG